jgi:hypothetical protein
MKPAAEEFGGGWTGQSGPVVDDPDRIDELRPAERAAAERFVPQLKERDVKAFADFTYQKRGAAF